MKITNKTISGVDFIYRNNSTGRPTKAHIFNDETENAFCGWNDKYFAEIYPKEEFSAHILDVCKKCLKNFNLKNNENETTKED